MFKYVVFEYLKKEQTRVDTSGTIEKNVYFKKQGRQCC